MDAYLANCLGLLRSGRPVIVLDLETTGLLPDWRNPPRVRPQTWEIGTIQRVRAGAGVVRTEARMVLNIGPLPEDLVAWNKSQGVELDPLITVREGLNPGVALAQLVRGVVGTILVGHNLTRFDARVLAGDLQAAGLAVPEELANPALQVDTLIWAQTLWPVGAAGSPVNHQLATVAAFVGYDRGQGVFHQALDDTRATEAILLAAYAETVRRERAETGAV